MDLFRRGDGRTASLLFRSATLVATLAAVGCASPGPPRAPSLNLPQPVRDLAVTRMGNTVELRFTAPSRSTDKLPLRGGKVAGQLCRQLEHQPCVPVAASKTTIATTDSSSKSHTNSSSNSKDKHDLITWTDTLPADLVQGSPRLLAYRVEFFSPAGRSAGASDPAFTATGPSPAPVEDLHAEGSRLGAVLAWNASAQPGDILLQREDLAPTHPKEHKTSTSPGTASPKATKATSTAAPKTSSNITAAAPSIVWLGTPDPTSSISPNRTLDTTIVPDTPYRYSALRRVTLQLGGHSIELRGVLSAPIPFALHEVYPPLAPTGLTAVGFFAEAPSASASAPSAFAIDLIWQPVDDTGLLAGLAGYNVYREPLNATGEPTAPRTRLNTAPILVPSFHDTTANPTAHYRYSITALDAKDNESPPATVLLEPSAAR
jgi:hypothetical protein